MTQCSSRGGFCGKRCQRTNVRPPQQAEDLFSRALSNAIYWQNRCCELEEIIEMFCLDAAEGESK